MNVFYMVIPHIEHRVIRFEGDERGKVADQSDFGGFHSRKQADRAAAMFAAAESGATVGGLKKDVAAD